MLEDLDIDISSVEKVVMFCWYFLDILADF
jgi:hypothetical protein